MAKITTNINHLRITGTLSITDLHFLLAVIGRLVDKQGHETIILNFSQCAATFAGPMLALACQIMKRRALGIATELILPDDSVLARLFVNANWAYLIDPEHHESSRFRGITQVPATHFTSPPEQQTAVNVVMSALLGSLREFSRSDLAAIEWSINEITDNVMVHAESPTGGLVQMTTFSRRQRRVEYAVCDAGVGIPASLRRGFPELTSDTDALFQAIRENVTRDKNIGQGNGLYGSYEVCRRSHGLFEIHSGAARLTQTEQRGLEIRREQVPYAGTLVIASVDYSEPHILADALAFGGKPFTPIDYIETRYEQRDANRIVFMMQQESPSVGSRLSGRPVRTKIENLLAMVADARVSVDFANVPLISSSFADEVFGRLFVQLGPTTFIQRIEFVNVSDTVRDLIDRAIAQRMATGR